MHYFLIVSGMHSFLIVSGMHSFRATALFEWYSETVDADERSKVQDVIQCMLQQSPTELMKYIPLGRL